MSATDDLVRTGEAVAQKIERADAAAGMDGYAVALVAALAVAANQAAEVINGVGRDHGRALPVLACVERFADDVVSTVAAMRVAADAPPAEPAT